MSGKLLFIIISGIENINRARWGLRMALNTFTHPYGDSLIDKVRVLLFCDGVKLVDHSNRFYDEIKERLHDLTHAGIEVASCVSIAEPLGLIEDTRSLGIACVHASAYLAKCVDEGFNPLTF